MEELIKTFHIDAKLIIAQLVNFAIVLFFFKKFAYKPIMKVLNDRTDKIEKGLADAEKANLKLKEVSRESKELIVDAKKEAGEIIKKTQISVAKIGDEMMTQSKLKAEKIIQKAFSEIEEEKRRVLFEAKSEISELVMLGMEKVLSSEENVEKFSKRAVESIIGKND